MAEVISPEEKLQAYQDAISIFIFISPGEEERLIGSDSEEDDEE